MAPVVGRRLHVVGLVQLAVDVHPLRFAAGEGDVVPPAIVDLDLAGDLGQAASEKIGVLPFTTRGTEEDTASFADGMHDDLLTTLTDIGGLKVISRTSVLQYRDTTKNLRQIGEELGMTIEAVRKALFRLKKQVRSCVETSLSNAE